MNKIARKILPLLKGKCDISNTSSGKFILEYSNVPYRLDGVSTPTLDVDGTAKLNFTTHYLYIPKQIKVDDEFIEITPAKVRRIKITQGSVEDRSRDLRVKQLVSNSDSGVLCFLCESGELEAVL
jgi:hypothetical protein